MSLLEQELNTVGARFRLREWWRNVSFICIMLAILGIALLCMSIILIFKNYEKTDVKTETIKLAAVT